MSTPQQRLEIAASILEFEARRDKQGRLKVYKLPAGDGGGTFEVADINDRYHPEEAAHLASLIQDGRHEEAEEQAHEIIAMLTDGVGSWSRAVALEAYLRDTAFNRGLRGAARILQRALGLRDDGVVGPRTRAALADAERDPATLLAKLRAAREKYERDVAGRDESSKFWRGLVNRWNKALDFAETFLAEEPVAPVTREARLEPEVPVPGVPFDAAEAAIAEAMQEQRRTAEAMPPPITRARPEAAAPPADMAAMQRDAPLPPEPVQEAPVLLPALRLGSRGSRVQAWQTFLLGQQLDPGGTDGMFGDKTAAATRAFQQLHGLTPDGVAGRQTVRKAMDLGFEVIEEPAPDMTGSNFPPRPNFAPLNGLRARQAVFGAFDYVPHPVPGNRENIRILGSWERDNIVMVPIPQLRTALGPNAPSGMRFHRLAAEQLIGLWKDWESAGLLGRVLSYDGAFVPRFIRGSSTTLSNHAFGSAFDINAATNPLGGRAPLVGERGSVRELVPLAYKWGFYWGGHFASRTDGMHFEIAFVI